MKRLLPFFFLFLLVFSACKKDEADNNESLNTGEPPLGYDFRFETVREHTLSLQFTNAQGKVVEHVHFELYTANPFEQAGEALSSNILPEALLYKAGSNQSGTVDVVSAFPTYLETVYLCPRHAGFAQVYEITLEGSRQNVIVQMPQRTTEKHAALSSASSYKSAALEDDYAVLGSWNANGLPAYLEPEPDVIDSDLLADINASLPERQPVPETNPQYLANGAEANLVLNQEAEVWVSFVHEGAGWKNVLGYYTYPMGNPPQSIEDITDQTILLPNVSYVGSGGELQSGDKVQLKYYDAATESFKDKFPANTVVAWFVNANGWTGDVNQGHYTHFSNAELNNETDDELKRHNVLLYDDERDIFVVGFEDILRESKSCDQDFNDVVFYAKVSPESAVQTTDMQPINRPKDTDNDGVTDVFDDFPDDPERAYKNQYPSAGSFGTLAYEDLWPSKGDYDLNDLVMDYQFEMVSNSANKIVDMQATFAIKAIGAGFRNGFGLAFDNLTPSQIQSVSGQQLTDKLITNNANGTEAGQSMAVVMLFDNAYQIMSRPDGGGFVNVEQGVPYVEPDTVSCQITLSTPLALDDLGVPPYNPFIIINHKRNMEVHLPGMQATDLVDHSLFKTMDDLSDPDRGLYYFSTQSFPWALHLPQQFDHPIEKGRVTKAYLYFSEWAESMGASHADWYLDKEGYRDNNYIYQKP